MTDKLAEVRRVAEGTRIHLIYLPQDSVLGKAMSDILRILDAPDERWEGEPLGLAFERLRAMNVERCVKGFGHALGSWSVAEWTNAMCGEAGEAANVAKKMLRHRDNVAGNKGADLDLWALRQKLGRELADTVIYLDLVCASQGLDLGRLVRETFNAKSDEIGAKEKL